MPKSDKYPCPIYMESTKLDGWCIIMRGHNLTAEQIQSELESEEPGTIVVDTEEVHFVHQPRVKHCSRYGINCDMDGDWHTHWIAVNENDDPKTHFTVASYRYAGQKVGAV